MIAPYHNKVLDQLYPWIRLLVPADSKKDKEAQKEGDMLQQIRKGSAFSWTVEKKLVADAQTPQKEKLTDKIFKAIMYED